MVKHLIVMCPSCEGYGWQTDEFEGNTEDCAWCGGCGYVYRMADGSDQAIPAADYAAVADILERMERERLRALGYSGDAKKPWEQAIRRRDEAE
jgi:hypothetical protein